MPERVAEAEPFGQPRGIDVHHHVDERFDLRGAPRLADVLQRCAHLLKHRLEPLVGLAPAADHQVERAVARLRNRAGHAGLQRFRAGCLREPFDLDVRLRRDRRAVDEEFSGGVGKQRVFGRRKDLVHRRVVGHDRDDDVGERGDARQRRGDFAAGLRGGRVRRFGVEIVERNDGIPDVVAAVWRCSNPCARCRRCRSFAGCSYQGRRLCLLWPRRTCKEASSSLPPNLLASRATNLGEHAITPSSRLMASSRYLL